MKAIVTFHSIDSSGSVLSYSPDMFTTLLNQLERASLPVLTLDQLLARDSQRGIALSFDDGMESVYTAAMPVLRDRNLPAHLFLTTSSVGSNHPWQSQPRGAPGFRMLDWRQLEQLHEAGIRIECHTHTHPDLRLLPATAIEEECARAEAAIEHALGRPPQYFAYPYGFHDMTVRDLIGKRYKAAVTTELGVLGSVFDRSRLPRLDSYYLRGKWVRRNLDSLPARSYLSIRSLLRSMRGTQ